MRSPWEPSRIQERDGRIAERSGYYSSDTGEWDRGKVRIQWDPDWPGSLTDDQKAQWLKRYLVLTQTTTYPADGGPTTEGGCEKLGGRNLGVGRHRRTDGRQNRRRGPAIPKVIMGASGWITSCQWRLPGIMTITDTSTRLTERHGIPIRLSCKGS